MPIHVAWIYDGDFSGKDRHAMPEAMDFVDNEAWFDPGSCLDFFSCLGLTKLLGLSVFEWGVAKSVA